MKIRPILTLMILGTYCFSYGQVDQEAVDRFIAEFSSKYNKDKQEITRILAGATFQSSIVERMDRPAEGMAWHRYRKIFMTEERVNAGVEFWKKHQQTLNEVSRSTGVDEDIILGILGVETFFGKITGTYKVLDALYTLSFGYPRRSKYFTSEFEQFLIMTEEEKMDVDNVLGSYAGAMGYSQFMPSSYRAYAKSFDEGGTRDLMNSPEDAIASVANYLKVHRWIKDGPIAVKAEKGDMAEDLGRQSLKPNHPLSYYQKLGYQPKDKYPEGDVTLVELEQEDTMEYWFGMNNFYVITRYNHSPMYAMVVYQLSQAIKAKKEGL